jgi:hypothetical protein
MTLITNEDMRKRMAQTKEYCVVILKAGPKRHKEGVGKIVWEHGRRNFALREEGVLSIVCPVADGSEVSGIGIFNVGIDRVRAIMDEDPGVREGVFVYEIHPCRSFPGDCLPK